MIIGVSGRKQSGKDTVGKIMQIMIDAPHFTNEGVKSFLHRELTGSFKIVKYADTLKDTMCMILGCTRKQLEDETFKNTELEEEWWYYNIGSQNSPIIKPRGYYPNASDNQMCEERYMVKPTPRLLLQLMGTECGREILHPNIWVNSLFSKYISLGKLTTWNVSNREDGKTTEQYPNWIITDVRFPNEVKPILDREGLIFRIESDRCNNLDKHPSETSLDDYQGFHEIIQNNGTIEELIEKVREILIKYKFI